MTILLENRRKFLTFAGAAGLTAAGVGFFAKSQQAMGTTPAFMSPNEDLMQEHALLNRVQLIYDEAKRRLKKGIELDPKILKEAATIIRRFVEEYHEKLEENYVFPRFEKAQKLVPLVTTLRAQHLAGRSLTEAILSLSTLTDINKPSQRDRLIELLEAFTRMYRPHEAREGSVLFPSLRDLVSPKEFGELGDMFEKKEHELLGKEGFEGQVKIVEELEKQLGLYDLAQYTPKV